MFRRIKTGRAVVLFLLALVITAGGSGCSILDDLLRTGSTVADDVPELVPVIVAGGSTALNSADDLDNFLLGLRGTLDDLFSRLTAASDEISTARRQAIEDELTRIGCELALDIAKGEEQPADVIEDQVYSTLVSEVGEAIGGELFGDSLAIVYTLAEEINNQSGGDPFATTRICNGL